MKDPTNVTSVGRPSVEVQASFSITGSTLERSLMYVMCVGKPSVRAPAFSSITGFILGRSPMFVMRVEELSVLTLISLST